ncbi:MAG TPA: hypothetical protein ENK63_03200, partial [Rhodobacterales bacterium]|nr:hypothetical protein [Rhodobacterales bacterium]
MALKADWRWVPDLLLGGEPEVLRAAIAADFGNPGGDLFHQGADLLKPGVRFNPGLVHVERAIDFDLHNMVATP